ncbi:MAG TPA: ferritin family protein [Phycisphaerae bacterium]|nr:ferritin family protein [Phycisphaerae bacterium]HOI54791.1 ferritin family protein [Phycisphaerae bacterium]
MAKTMFNDVEAAKIAVNMERSGLAFYTYAAARVKDPAVRKVFERLASDEREHITAFEDLHERLLQEPRRESYFDDEAIDLYMRRLVGSHVFSDEGAARRLLDDTDSDIAALGLAMRVERDVMLYYQEMLNFSASPAAREVFQAIAEQERRHLMTLAERSEKCEDFQG